MTKNVIEMRKCSRALIGTLSVLLEAQKELLESSKVMQKHLVACDPKSLNDEVQHQRELIEALTAAENERSEAAKEWHRAAGRQGEALTVSEIAAECDVYSAAELNRLAGELKDVIREQQGINEQNKVLLEISTQYTEFVIGNFMGEPLLNNIYGSNGELMDDSFKSRIDGEV